MATVFVVQENPSKNILPAAQYGEISILCPFGQIGFSPGPLVRRLYRALQKFNDNDFILCMGDPVLIGVTCAYAATINNGRFKSLKWDRQECCYYPVQIDLYPERKESYE